MNKKKVFSHFVGDLFSLQSISFVVEKFVISCSPICQYFLLVADHLSSIEEVIANAY
jgi:hypothetical protein